MSMHLAPLYTGLYLENSPVGEGGHPIFQIRGTAEARVSISLGPRSERRGSSDSDPHPPSPGPTLANHLWAREPFLTSMSLRNGGGGSSRRVGSHRDLPGCVSVRATGPVGAARHHGRWL